MTDLLIGASLGATFLAGAALLIFHWLGELPKKQTVTLPAPWPTDLLWVVEDNYKADPLRCGVTLNLRTDPIEEALDQRVSTWDELKQYRRAKAEIMNAFNAGRLPAPWAVNTVRAYREAFAAAAEAHTTQLHEETARLRQGAMRRPPNQWGAEVVRPRQPHRPQLGVSIPRYRSGQLDSSR